MENVNQITGETPTRKLWNDMEQLALAINHTFDSTIRALTHVHKLGIDEKISSEVEQDNILALEETLMRLRKMSKEFDHARLSQGSVHLWFGKYPGDVE